MQVTLQAELYRDPQAYQLERQLVFASGWQFLGHEDGVAWFQSRIAKVHA